MSGQDQTDTLIAAVMGARAEGQPMAIAGSGSKRFLCDGHGGERQVRLLSTVEHSGILDYRPAELVIRARSGTPLKLVRQTLARERQMLAFDPPEFQGLGTIGGAVAAGLSGPGRLSGGRVRDSVLGVVMINGLGERLEFGGQVMKNVAGFDVSRLQAGAFGMFGVLLEVSLKCVPLPAASETRALEVGRDQAIEHMTSWARRPLPIVASAWEEGVLRVRLAGAEQAIAAAASELGGQNVGDDYWNDLRDQRRPFFRHRAVGVRNVPPASPALTEDGVIEWNGARRWVGLTDAPEIGGLIPFDTDYARRICWEAGGNQAVAAVQRQLKTAFDPEGLFNPEIGDADDAA